MRKTKFVNEEYYHIFNRGVDKRHVFIDGRDYIRFLLGMKEFNDENLTVSLRDRQLRIQKLSFGNSRSLASVKKIVGIIAYCLNPNHYHFILKQKTEKGIEGFMQRLGTSYTKYFNIKNNRSGSLFQGTFKSTHIKSNSLLLHLSAYVNCNSEVHGIAKAEKYHWCSFPDYIGKRNDGLSEKNIVLNQFRNPEDFKEFAKKNAKAMREKKEFEKMLLE